MFVKELPYKDGKLRLRLRVLSQNGFGWAIIYVGSDGEQRDVVHSARLYTSPSQALGAGLDAVQAYCDSSGSRWAMDAARVDRDD